MPTQLLKINGRVTGRQTFAAPARILPFLILVAAAPRYDRVVKTSAFLAGILGITGFVSPAQSQCDAVPVPAKSLSRDLGRDIAPVFERIKPSKSSGTESVRDRSLKLEEEFLIVPAKRVGTFEIGATYSKVKTLVNMSGLKDTADERYIDVLPLGYIPQRRTAQASKQKLSFAFSASDSTLSEVWVKDNRYATSEGIRVGSPASALDRVPNLIKKNGRDGSEYLQGGGITFVVTRGVVSEIVILRVLR